MTQANWKKPLILAATLLVLGSFAYWLEFSHKPQKEEREEQSKKLFKLKDAAVAKITIVNGSKRIVFQCTDLEKKLCKPGDSSRWDMLEPLKLKADDMNVNSLLTAANQLSSTETFDLASESAEKRKQLLAEYKLSGEQRESARKLEITLAQGGTESVTLGDTHPIGEGIFALAAQDESKVYLVGSYFKSNFDKELGYWRDKKLFSIGVGQITGFELQGTKAKFSAKRKDNLWSLRVGSQEMPGDIENIDSILSSATFLTAQEFAAENKGDPQGKAALSGAKNFFTLKLETDPSAGGKPIELRLYEKAKPKPLLLATVSSADPVYQLEPGARNRLDKELKEFRLAKLVTATERFTAKKLSFSGAGLGKDPLVILNTDAKWVDQATQKEVDNAKLQNLLDKVSGNRIKEYLPSAPGEAQSQAQGLRLTLFGDKDEKKREILFWKSGDKLYAKDLLAKRKETYLIDPAVTAALPWERNFFNPAPPQASPTPAGAKTGRSP